MLDDDDTPTQPFYPPPDQPGDGCLWIICIMMTVWFVIAMVFIVWGD